MVVYPSLEPKPGFEQLLSDINGDLEAHYRGRGHEFYRIRAYEPLESARYVDWKATAHTRSLQVREFARDEDQMIVIYLDLDAAPAQDAWFESAVECAAFVAFYLSENGHRVRLRTQEFDMVSPAEGDIYAILRYLALVSRRTGAGLPSPDPSCQIRFQLRPHGVEAAGWTRLVCFVWRFCPGSRFLGPFGLR